MICFQCDPDTHLLLHCVNSSVSNSFIMIMGYDSMYALHSKQNYNKFELSLSLHYSKCSLINMLIKLIFLMCFYSSGSKCSLLA